MKCINHDDVEAIGICKNCFKAVCKQCIVPNQYDFIVCSANCLEEAAAAQIMTDKAKMAYGLKPGRLPVTSIFTLLSGFFFSLWGLLTILGGSLWGFFVLALGAIFIVAGVLYWVNQRKSGIKV